MLKGSERSVVANQQNIVCQAARLVESTIRYASGEQLRNNYKQDCHSECSTHAAHFAAYPQITPQKYCRPPSGHSSLENTLTQGICNPLL